MLVFGEEGTGPGQFRVPHAVAIVANGDVFVSDEFNHRIQHFTSSGVFLHTFGEFGSGPGQFYGPMGIAVDPNGNVYVADSTNYRVQKWGPINSTPVRRATVGGLKARFRSR